jgi:long-chain acyl-CoA synthetase
LYPGAFASTTPDKPAIVMGDGQSTTYQELDDRSAQLAQLLYARGLRKGDHIAILAENHVRYFEVYWAAMRSGLYLTAVNRYLKADEAAYLVNRLGSRGSGHYGRYGVHRHRAHRAVAPMLAAFHD